MAAYSQDLVKVERKGGVASKIAGEALALHARAEKLGAQYDEVCGGRCKVGAEVWGKAEARGGRGVGEGR
eukprot:68745-Chlamydomonas_euryale.AAC.1